MGGLDGLVRFFQRGSLRKIFTENQVQSLTLCSVMAKELQSWGDWLKELLLQEASHSVPPPSKFGRSMEINWTPDLKAQEPDELSSAHAL